MPLVNHYNQILGYYVQVYVQVYMYIRTCYVDKVKGASIQIASHVATKLVQNHI